MESLAEVESVRRKAGFAEWAGRPAALETADWKFRHEPVWLVRQLLFRFLSSKTMEVIDVFPGFHIHRIEDVVFESCGQRPEQVDGCPVNESGSPSDKLLRQMQQQQQQ